MTGWIGAVSLLFYLLLMVVFALYEAAGSYAALQANAGVKAAFGQAWAVAWRKAGRYTWLAILRASIVCLPIVFVAGLAVASFAYAFAHAKGSGGPGAFLSLIPLLVLLYLGALVYAILALLRIVFAVPACVAENLSAWKAVCRSNQLTQGAKGRIFLIGLLLYAVIYVATMVLEFVALFFVVIGALVGKLAHLTMVPWGWIGIAVLAAIAICAFLLISACIWAIYSTAIVVIYHDQRLRKESSASAG